MSSELRTYVTTTNHEVADLLFDMTRPLSKAKVTCLKLVLEGKLSKSQINTELQQEYRINKRLASGVITYVEGAVKSARECRSHHLQQLQGKLKHVQEVIEKLEKKIKAHQKYLRAVEQVNRGQKKKLPKTLKPRYPDACPMRCAHHLTHYEFAKVKLHNKKRYAHKLVQQIDTCQQSPLHVTLGNLETIEMVGSKDESYGNQICQLDLFKKELHIRVPYCLEPLYGMYVVLPIVLPKHGQDNLATAWFNKQAITYRFIPRNKGWQIHITVAVEPSPIQTQHIQWGGLGVDLNPGSLGWTKADRDGNLEAAGQIKLNIQSQPKGRTEAILVDAVTQLTELALQYKCPIVVEKLDFSDKKKRLREMRASHNRMLSNFAYSKFLELLKARCFKLGIELIEVNPTYSSLIGLVKFMSVYGLNSATAAGLVLARRAMHLSERPPARTAYYDMESRKHVWSNWRIVAKRVKGTSRHSFFQPRLTVCSRLRTDREISTDATLPRRLGESGENPLGSRHTAGRRIRA
jgi:IS605 OrfB family transposase